VIVDNIVWCKLTSYGIKFDPLVCKQSPHVTQTYHNDLLSPGVLVNDLIFRNMLCICSL